MMKKNGFSRCAEMYIGRLRKERMCMKMHFFLSEGFVVPLLCHSDK